VKIEYVTDIEELRRLGESWLELQNGDKFGIKIDVDAILKDAAATLKLNSGVVIGAKENDEWVGFMHIFVAGSFLGDQLMAVEKYWYARPNAIMAAPRMLAQAKIWAAEKGCSHLIMSASNLASDKYPHVCGFYTRCGLKLFESSYICEIK